MNPIESNTEDLEESSEPLTKPKKPRSQKQMDAFQEALRKRAVNVELRKQEKLIKASEILVQKAKMENPTPYLQLLLELEQNQLYRNLSQMKKRLL